MGNISSGSEIIQKYQSLAGSDVTNAVYKASQKTGVDFSYLMEKAAAESNFDTDVKAKTSSATGLFQFIDQTWLQMVAKHGYKHGLGHLGQQIDINEKGYARAKNSAVKREILELRKNPEIASNMAAEFAKDNQTYLKRHTKGNIGSTEMYLAHFLGAGSAGKFINAMDRSEGQNAAKLFPAAAKANKPVFYNADGSSRSLKQVYEFFDKKFSDQPAPIMAEKPPATVPSNVIEGDYTFASNEIDKEKAMEIYNGIVGNSFSSFHNLYDVQSEIDVMLLSDMISRFTHDEASRAYQTSDFTRIL